MNGQEPMWLHGSFVHPGVRDFGAVGAQAGETRLETSRCGGRPDSDPEGSRTRHAYAPAALRIPHVVFCAVIVVSQGQQLIEHRQTPG